MSKVIAVNSEYRTLPLSQLQESPTNPRRRFDERALQELAASFTTQGVLQPLLVRSVEDDKFEVVAGARRFRAATLAKLHKVPVRVVELSDAAVRESQLAENLLREDVHPYEEALALSGLLHLEGAQYNVSSIAARLGKSPAYITTRIRLTELVPSIAEAFLADRIGVSHALEIAKLPPAQQEKAFDAAFLSLSRQPKCIPIVATQSISSLKEALPNEGVKTLLQAFRTKIFLTTSDPDTARYASELCGKTDRTHISYTVSESSNNANVGWLSGRTSSSKGSVSASKQYQKRREPLFEENVFYDLKNAQSVVVAFDGISPLPPTYCYLKPDFLPVAMTWFDQERIGFEPKRIRH